MIHIKHYIEIFQMGFSAMINATDKKIQHAECERCERIFYHGQKGKKNKKRKRKR
jgi:hypothetical protein